MFNSFNNTWWVFLLIAAGGVILFLSMYARKPQGDQGVVLNDIFHQPVTPESVPSTSVPIKKADPIPAMGIVTTPVNGQEAGFTIQVYSFQDKNRAETALQALKTNGYQAFLVMSDLGEKGVWYRVRIGGIADEAAAHKMLDEIRKTYNSGFILKPKN